jgi:serine/threonine protein kinase
VNRALTRAARCAVQDLEHLLSGLLATDPHVRLTAAQAMCHPWFDGFDWSAFLDGSMPAPAIPIYHQLPNQRPDAGGAGSARRS